jgi:hypothetical protein
VNPDVRTGVLLLTVIWCVFILALTIAATGAFFWPPATFGELLADGFTVLGVVLVGAMLRFVIGALRQPPDK